jgi:hypothetical protein
MERSMECSEDEEEMTDMIDSQVREAERLEQVDMIERKQMEIFMDRFTPLSETLADHIREGQWDVAQVKRWIILKHFEIHMEWYKMRRTMLTIAPEWWKEPTSRERQVACLKLMSEWTEMYLDFFLSLI